MLGDIRVENIRGWRWLRSEIDLDHATANRVRRRELFQRQIDPERGRIRKIEIAVEALDHAFGAERGETRVDCLADSAKLHISDVAEREHAELDAIEARSLLSHQFRIIARGTRGRLTLAPGGGTHH